jgi:hypothetical protein
LAVEMLNRCSLFFSSLAVKLTDYLAGHDVLEGAISNSYHLDDLSWAASQSSCLFWRLFAGVEIWKC